MLLVDTCVPHNTKTEPDNDGIVAYLQTSYPGATVGQISNNSNTGGSLWAVSISDELYMILIIIINDNIHISNKWCVSDNCISKNIKPKSDLSATIHTNQGSFINSVLQKKQNDTKYFDKSKFMLTCLARNSQASCLNALDSLGK